MKRVPHIYVLIGILLLLCAGITSCRRDKVYRIGVSQCSSDDWRNKMNEEMRRAALCDESIELEIRSADDNNAKQISDIRYFADNGFDLIIAAPNEAKAITPVIREVYDRGIPVIVTDRDIEGNSYTSHIHADNEGIGRQAANYALSMFRHSDVRPKALEITGLMGSTPAKGRKSGFETAFKAGGGTLLASVDAQWNQPDAERVTDSLLKIYPETNVIYAHNDRMAIGASKVARRMGRNDIRILGTDAAPEIGIKAVSDSLIDATFLYPTEGYLVIQTAMNVLRGDKFPREIVLPASSAVDLSNADILLRQNESLQQETETITDLKDSVDDYWRIHSIQTNLFYAVIVIMVLALAIIFIMIRAVWIRKRHQEILEQKNRELEEYSREQKRLNDEQKRLNDELNAAIQSKMTFYTNVSHDLRTPLTIITEPVRQLASASNLTPSQQTLARLAEKNVHILNRLINQILDFRKFESGKLSVHRTAFDFAQAVTEWTDSFRGMARSRDIRFTLTPPAPEVPMMVCLDAEKMERIYYNLVANALKYTRDNGSVNIEYGLEADNVYLQVTDSGIGIAREELKRIFDSFYQIDKVRPTGSGIGLSLTKTFVELHGGEITVTSEPGRGSTFRVSIPRGDLSECVSDTPLQTELQPQPLEREEIKSTFERIAPIVTRDDNDGTRPTVLVVDDNADMVALLTQELGTDYDVRSACNGREGLAKATRMVPDLIISDVMMPVMNGLEFCRMIKDEVSTSHVPVLLITACAMDQQRAEGYDSGADGYLAKPFGTEVLLARCRSLIANRKRIMSLWKEESAHMTAGAQKGETAVRTKTVGDTDPDNMFYNRFLEIFNAHISDADLNIDTIASEMGLGHSQFYRKIKALTNYTPVDLIRRLRLQRSRELLLTTEFTVSEIAYKVGFSAPAYFTKCFRAVFEETPSELRERLQK